MATHQSGYLGNPLLKKAGTTEEFTEEQIAEYIKCSQDPVYFILNYVKIVNVDEGLVPFTMYDFQEKIVNTVHNNRFTIAKLPRQSGKALALDTPINTPMGWSTMGKLKVGDKVYGSDGQPAKITFATDTMDNHKCYDITFDTGETIKADADHLWVVSCSDWCGKKKTLTTEDIISLHKTKRDGGRPLYIEVSNPIEYPEAQLPINPYILGLWLGDGNSRDGRYTAEHSDNIYMRNKIIQEGFSLAPIYKDKRGLSELQTIYGLFPLLRTNNLLQNKHIPDIYLRSSIEQRLNLIQGLMDTDGSCGKDGACEFYQKSLDLINQVREILFSLGIKNRIRSRELDGELYYSLAFTTTSYDVFTMPRKLKRQQKALGHLKNTRHYIDSIIQCESVPVRCIQVDNDDHMFLCGKSMIPTHNTTTVVSYFLHFILFNEDVNIAILANKGSLARDILGRLQLAYENLPPFLQQGIKVWNRGDMQLENGSKIVAASTSSSAVRGGTYNMILLDEFAFVPKNIADEFFSSVYPTISSGVTTKVIIVSTPCGMNHFYKLWSDAQEKKNLYQPVEVHWSEVPGRDEKWKEETIKNTSKEQFAQEFSCEFIGSINTLINATKLKNMPFGEPIKKIGDIDIYEEPQEGHVYTLIVDVSHGEGLDYSAFSIIDSSEFPYKQIAKYRNATIPPLTYPTVVHNAAQKYNDAFILVEINDIGQQVADILHHDLEYDNMLLVTQRGRAGQVLGGGFGVGQAQLGVKTTRKVKQVGCLNLKSLIESDKLLIEDFDTIAELTSFVSKGYSYEAESGHNDDLVMTLVLFCWLTTQPYFKDLTDVDARKRILADKTKAQEEDLLPFGFIDSGASMVDDVKVDRGDGRWLWGDDLTDNGDNNESWGPSSKFH